MIGLESLVLGCPHGANSTPTTCSQCLGSVPRVIRITDGLVSMDHIPLGTLRQLNDQRREAEKGIPRPVVRMDQPIYANRGIRRDLRTTMATKLPISEYRASVTTKLPIKPKSND